MADERPSERKAKLRDMRAIRMRMVDPQLDKHPIRRIRRSKALPDLTGKRIACCGRNQKRAALLFDVVLSMTTLADRDNPDYDEMPDWVAADALTAYEKFFSKAARMVRSRQARAMPLEFDLVTWQAVERDAYLAELARIFRVQGAAAAAVDLEYPGVLLTPSTPPSAFGISGALRCIPVAIERELSWKLVHEFRRDEEARQKYRDLHLWLEHGLAAESEQHAADMIGQKFDDYRWAIRKHGLTTKLEAISSILASGALLPATSRAVSELATVDGRVAALVGAAFAALGITAWVGKRAVDLENLKRGENREIAYLYEVTKLE